jgi:transposase
MVSLVAVKDESWIPPADLLDLHAQVRLRHTLSHQRGEWQQRIQAVLYHHGCPQRGELLTLAGRAWLTAQPLPPAAREQITVAATGAAVRRLRTRGAAQ